MHWGAPSFPRSQDHQSDCLLHVVCIIPHRWTCRHASQKFSKALQWADGSCKGNRLIAILMCVSVSTRDRFRLFLNRCKKQRSSLMDVGMLKNYDRWTILYIVDWSFQAKTFSFDAYMFCIAMCAWTWIWNKLERGITQNPGCWDPFAFEMQTCLCYADRQSLQST